jgi:hypothetical protein
VASDDVQREGDRSDDPLDTGYPEKQPDTDIEREAGNVDEDVPDEPPAGGRR